MKTINRKEKMLNLEILMFLEMFKYSWKQSKKVSKSLNSYSVLIMIKKYLKTQNVFVYVNSIFLFNVSSKSIYFIFHPENSTKNVNKYLEKWIY